MNDAFKIAKYTAQDTLRSKWVLGYGVVVLITTDLLLRFGGSGPKVLLSLANVVLLLIPLVSVLFGTLHVYNGRAFIEMLLAQPVRRRHLYTGLVAGLGLPLGAGFVAGTVLPFALRGPGVVDLPIFALLIGMGLGLTAVFVGIAVAITAFVDEKARGFGLALVAWLFFTLVYDGLVLVVVQAFAQYPLERPLIALMMLNPVDLARIVFLIQFDASAMMGYTGAVFERFFGGTIGPVLAALGLFTWILVPFLIGRRRFLRRDF